MARYRSKAPRAKVSHVFVAAVRLSGVSQLEISRRGGLNPTAFSLILNRHRDVAVDDLRIRRVAELLCIPPTEVFGA